MHVSTSSSQDGSRPLRVGHDDAFAPFGAVEAGRSQGLLVDIFQATTSRLGWAVAFRPLPMADAEAALIAHEVDLLLGVADTPARRDRLALSAPLMTTGGAWFRLADDDGPLRGPVATPASGPLIAAIAERFPELVVRTTADYPTALAAVISGRAGAAALNIHAGWRQVETLFAGQFKRPTDVFVALDLVAAAAAGDPKHLIPHLNSALSETRAGKPPA